MQLPPQIVYIRPIWTILRMHNGALVISCELNPETTRPPLSFELLAAKLTHVSLFGI